MSTKDFLFVKRLLGELRYKVVLVFSLVFVIIYTHVQFSSEEQNIILNSRFTDWVNQGEDEQIDDVCIVGVKL